ncbi:MAG TPA: glycosyl hydrolase family 79 C-terminal domain-containing protein [Solirubrobacteraceae bacterium]|nr:glycosyl hydrolase family 79 C-terminal domain-containing protein [Solirubrobacteraceae bacterium]
MRRARSLLVSAAAALVLAAAAPASPAANAPVITVGGPAATRPIPAGFLGLSLEYFAIPAYAGTDPSNLDPVFLQLVRNLSVGAPPNIRIGGDTTDGTWWPVPGTPTPAGVKEALTPGWADITQALAAALGARLTLGINLEADSTTIAATEADELVSDIGRSRIEALELGNEPELYGTFTWGRSGKPGRPHDYNFAAFSRDFTRIARALPNLPLAGPTTGGSKWFTHIRTFLADHTDVKVTTLHRYPLQLCYRTKNEPDFPTISHLMSAGASRGLADSVAGAVKASHARHIPLRIDELNTIGCGSDRAVSESFASALWAVDALFNMARVGVDGVNISSFPGATDEPFAFTQADGQWQGQVMPEYYGLDMFAQAAPPGARLLNVSPTGAPQLDTWATQSSDGTVRVVLINESAHAHTVRLRIQRTSAPGTLEYLTAPSLKAQTGVTLGGQSFGASTTTGRLAGAPHTTAVAPRSGRYAVRLPAASAAMLTVPAR